MKRMRKALVGMNRQALLVSAREQILELPWREKHGKILGGKESG